MTLEAVEFIRSLAVIWMWCIALGIIIQTWSEVKWRDRKCLIAFAIFSFAVYGILVSGWIKIIPVPWTEDTIFLNFSRKVPDITGRHDFAAPIRAQ